MRATRGGKGNAGRASLAASLLAGILACVFSALSLPGRPSLEQATESFEPAPEYAGVAAALERLITREMSEKQLRAFSIAVVDRRAIVWARGFGYSDAGRRIPATAETVYRVGPVSEVITDYAVLQLVQRGTLSLDAPVSRYLPDFHPANPFATPITLRELMARESGLEREPPTGGIFDSRSPSLAATVGSLNGTRLVYWPSTHAKESDAAIAVAGLAVERALGEPFAEAVQNSVFEPLGMRESSFAAGRQPAGRAASGEMWTYDGEIEAPTFALGVSPAEGLSSSVIDLGRFLGALFSAGRALRPAPGPRPVEEMWTPQFAPPGAESGFGLGFRIGRLDGEAMASSGGSLYGFTTELDALPGEQLGVVVATPAGGATGVASHIATVALRLMLAARHHRHPPVVLDTEPLSPESARSFAGRYGSLDTAFDLLDRQGRLYFLPVAGGEMIELRRLGSWLIEDGRLGYGLLLRPIPGGIRIEYTIFPSFAPPKPKPLPAAWEGLCGEYGWPYGTISVFEKDGKLTALVDSFDYVPLRESAADDFLFPPGSPYDGEHAVFARGGSGVATEIRIGDMRFPRRPASGETRESPRHNQ